jgi:DNA-binding transcriptional LysR family regulator
VNIERFRVFLMIVEEGSFRRAAERLFLSQPSVSQHIAALEREYDVRLFERRGRSVSLTPEGRALHVLATDLLRKADDIPARFREMQLLKYGKLAISATSYALYRLVPEAFRLFREQFPHISLSLSTGESREATAAVANGSAELALLGKDSGYPPEPGLTCRVLGIDPLVTVATEGASGLPLIRYAPGCPLAPFANSLFVRPRSESPDALTVNSIDAAKALALHGAGQALLPASCVAEEIGNGRLRRIGAGQTEQSPWEIQVCYSTIRGLSYAGWEMVRILDRCAGDIFASPAPDV